MVDLLLVVDDEVGAVDVSKCVCVSMYHILYIQESTRYLQKWLESVC